jgi:hypothetical protein
MNGPYPHRIVLPTRQAFLHYETQMASMSIVEQHLDELGAFLLEALQTKEYAVQNMEALIEYYGTQYEGEECTIAMRAIAPLNRVVYEAILAMDLWTDTGELPYSFERWLHHDMVIVYHSLVPVNQTLVPANPVG